MHIKIFFHEDRLSKNIYVFSCDPNRSITLFIFLVRIILYDLDVYIYVI